MRNTLILSIALLCLNLISNAQSFSINTDGSIADTSAILDIKSTTKGVLVSRMTKAERNLIFQPATGLLIFQSGPDSAGFHYYNGSAWVWLAAATADRGWLTTGNSGIDSTINFLGTLDTRPIMLRYNNTWMGQLNPGIGSYFIGKGAGLFNSGIRYNVAMGDSALANNTTGGENTALGFYSQKGQAGLSTGGANTSIGARALQNITTGGQNVAIGHYAMASMQTGAINVVLGPGAMEAATKGNSNVGLGLWALRTNDSASNNIAIGTSSLYWNKRDNNVAVGVNAGNTNSYAQTDPLLGIENTYIGYQSGYNANTGSKNVAIGFNALLGQGFFGSDQPGNTFYKRNVAIGDSAMTFSYGSDNVAIGYKTLSKSTNTSYHVAVGSRALSNTIAIYPNTAVGYSSMDSATTATANTAIGTYSLRSIKGGQNNTAIGNASMMDALGNASDLSNNTAVGNNSLRKARFYGNTSIGAESLSNDTAGVYNTAVGYYALNQNSNGYNNTAVGTSGLRYNLTGIANTAVGLNAMFNHKFNHNNTSIGAETMFADTSGHNNSVLGWRALRYSKNAFESVAIGVGAHEFADSSNQNVVMGRGAMIAAGGIQNTAIGTYASGSTNFDINNTYILTRTTSIGAYAGWKNIGTENTFGGYGSGAGFGSDTLRGIENTGWGALSLANTTNGKSNTALGMGALYNNTTGNGNVGVGTRALVNTTTGNYNVAVGDSSMWFNGGNGNTAVGTLTLAGNSGTGHYNSALGHFALRNNFNGVGNTAVGDSALFNNSTGSYNTAIGYLANTANFNHINSNAIGSYARSDASNTLILGSVNGINGATATVNVGIGRTSPNARLHVVRNGISGGAYHPSASMILEDNANSYFQFTNPNGNETGFISGNAATLVRSAIIFGADSTMYLRTGGNSNRVMIDNNGYVGIATTSPDSLFSVADNFLVNNAGTVQYANTTPTMMYMFKTGSLNADRMVIAHSPSASNWGLQYQDLTDQFNFIGNGVNRMTIELSTGQVGLGMAPTTQLELSLNSAQKPTSSAWFITSDQTLKTIDGKYTRGLNDVLKLNTIMYHYNPGNARHLPSDEQGYGLSAQEVQKVFPEAVKRGEDGYLRLDMHPILVSYINAFKDQQKQLDDKQKQLDDQKKIIDELLKRVEKLENK